MFPTPAPRGMCPQNPSFGLDGSPSPNTSENEFDSKLENSVGPESSHSDDEPETRILNPYRHLTTAQLENGVDKRRQVAENLDAILSSCPREIKGILQYAQKAKSLRNQSTEAKVIIGVIGQTGAGKSSVINSILDEERIIPTNCMRACTAVVTEIAYNTGERHYAFEVEYIDPDEWKNELQIIFQDLRNSDEKFRNSTKSDYAIAVAKMKAVYPTLKDVLQSSPDELVQEKSVRNLLGTRSFYDDDDPVRLHDKLRSYVDSCKNNKRSTKNGERPETDLQIDSEPELWPLIRVVRVYVKAPVLSTGAVIVDLPGTRGSNAARAAVAEKNKEKCTALWIVSPVTRAVNDENAQNMLSESARTQLKIDCGFNGVSFVCSKTDDICIAEARDALDMNAEFALFRERLREIEAKGESLQNELKMSRSEETEIAESLKEINEQLDAMDENDLKREPEDDINQRPHQRPRLNDSENVSNTATSEEPNNGIGTGSETRGNPRVVDGIQKRRSALAHKKVLKDKLERIISKNKDTTNQQENMNTKKGDAEAEFHAQCITARNDYAKSIVRDYFASSVKEIDQESAQDSPVFDPDVDMRDYNELAKSLPVFCVSSRAYQILRGRFAGEQLISGFRNAEDTEITELQAHCVKSTEAPRRRNCSLFLNDYKQLLKSLRLWASAVPRTLTDAESRDFKEEVDRKLSELHTVSEKVTCG